MNISNLDLFQQIGKDYTAKWDDENFVLTFFEDDWQLMVPTVECTTYYKTKQEAIDKVEKLCESIMSVLDKDIEYLFVKTGPGIYHSDCGGGWTYSIGLAAIPTDVIKNSIINLKNLKVRKALACAYTAI